MNIIKDKIVFSNDIMRILNGNNSLNYNYTENGIIIPNQNYIQNLRDDFKKTVNTIFQNQTMIITEENMLESIYDSISPFYRRYPHYFTR